MHPQEYAATTLTSTISVADAQPRLIVRTLRERRSPCPRRPPRPPWTLPCCRSHPRLRHHRTQMSTGRGHRVEDGRAPRHQDLMSTCACEPRGQRRSGGGAEVRRRGHGAMAAHRVLSCAATVCRYGVRLRGVAHRVPSPRDCRPRAPPGWRCARVRAGPRGRRT